MGQDAVGSREVSSLWCFGQGSQKRLNGPQGLGGDAGDVWTRGLFEVVPLCVSIPGLDPPPP